MICDTLNYDLFERELWPGIDVDRIHLVVLQGRLRLSKFSRVKKNIGFRLRIWELINHSFNDESDHGSWSLIHKVKVEKIAMYIIVLKVQMKMINLKIQLGNFRFLVDMTFTHWLIMNLDTGVSNSLFFYFASPFMFACIL